MPMGADPEVADWVQDAARAQLRRRLKERKRDNGFWIRGRVAGWRRKLSEAYDAGQAWIVVSLIGTTPHVAIEEGCCSKRKTHLMKRRSGRYGNTLLMSLWERVGTCIGLNAAFLNIITEWLSDIKQGHCTTAWYLNENFCCWGADHSTCIFFPPHP